MENRLSSRIKSVPESFIRKILKVSIQPDVISFAGGHPSADLFPVTAIQDACNKVLDTNGKQALQYAGTEGDQQLRNWIAGRYEEKQGLTVSPENILITNGSQQALDLIGKVLLNKGDSIAIENPGYLGAIQAFSLYQPNMRGVTLHDEGLDIEQLLGVLKKHQPKCLYTVPDFQNPTGISYSEENRKAITEAVKGKNSLIIQDSPYGELRYKGKDKRSFYADLPQQTLLLGSFSKIVIPSFRLGWIVAPDWLIKPLTIAKQAADLHTNFFAQQVIAQYLQDNSLDAHVESICQFYGRRQQCMLDAIKSCFPTAVTVTQPEGGMFLWATLPAEISAMELFDHALKEKVAFVPGEPFYVKNSGEQCPQNTLRLSYVTADEAAIQEGIQRLGKSISQLAM